MIEVISESGGGSSPDANNTDWTDDETYRLTPNWTANFTHTSMWKRDRDSLKVRGMLFFAGEPTGGGTALSLAMPSGLTAHWPSGGTSDQVRVGGVAVDDGATPANSFAGGGAFMNLPNSPAILSLRGPTVNLLLKSAFSAGDALSYDVEIPIAEWRQDYVPEE